MAYGSYEIAAAPSLSAVHALARTDRQLAALLGEQSIDPFTGAEAAFIASCDMAIIAGVSDDGWPRVSHHAGPRGFLKLLGSRTLAFAEYPAIRTRGTGAALEDNERVSLLLLDQANHVQLTVRGTVELLEPGDDPDLAEQVSEADYRGAPARVIRLHLDAFEWAQPNDMTERFTRAEFAEATTPLADRLFRMEQESAAIRACLKRLGDN